MPRQRGINLFFLQQEDATKSVIQEVLDSSPISCMNLSSHLLLLSQSSNNCLQSAEKVNSSFVNNISHCWKYSSVTGFWNDLLKSNLPGELLYLDAIIDNTTTLKTTIKIGQILLTTKSCEHWLIQKPRTIFVCHSINFYTICKLF